MSETWQQCLRRRIADGTAWTEGFTEAEINLPQERGLPVVASMIEDMLRANGATEIRQLLDDGDQKIWGFRYLDTPFSMTLNVTP